MALAEYKDLCVDAGTAGRLGPFWATLLDREWDPNRPRVGRVLGLTRQHTIWFNEVPEPKTVKHRVHLDIYTRALTDLEAIGATVLEPQREGWGWTVMADPEGGEFCAFLREELPAERLHGVVVGSVNPAEIAGWWAEVYDADLDHHGGEWATVEHIAGMPIETLDFVPVPEPKTVKNGIHWDVVAPDVEALVAHGATVLRRPNDEISWTVLADPEGNEFCAFDP
jgi:predicted enzyme related to lactoylglutathione lyase